MPTWVMNNLLIYSNDRNQKELIDFLEQHLIDDIFDFNTVIPEPQKPDECREKYDFNVNGKDSTGFDDWFDWYHWRLDHWGTKWNNGDKTYFDYDKILNSDISVLNELSICFRTAWNAPYQVAVKLIEMHPELDISWNYYSFENMEAGTIFVYDGEIIDDRYQLDNCNETILKV